jgi:hypothetical protein
MTTARGVESVKMEAWDFVCNNEGGLCIFSFATRKFPTLVQKVVE